MGTARLFQVKTRYLSSAPLTTKPGYEGREFTHSQLEESSNVYTFLNAKMLFSFYLLLRLETTEKEHAINIISQRNRGVDLANSFANAGCDTGQF